MSRLCPITCRAGSMLFWRMDKFFINIDIGLQQIFLKRLERNEIATKEKVRLAALRKIVP